MFSKMTVFWLVAPDYTALQPRRRSFLVLLCLHFDQLCGLISRRALTPAFVWTIGKTTTALSLAIRLQIEFWIRDLRNTNRLWSVQTNKSKSIPQRTLSNKNTIFSEKLKHSKVFIVEIIKCTFIIFRKYRQKYKHEGTLAFQVLYDRRDLDSDT